MPLTLKIISKQRHILGADSTRVFSVHGGSIGRAPDNDWVLPDPDRYISGHHASVDYRSGAYYLRDNSTNGVFVNHSSEPVGRGTPIRLYDGDELRMGDYLFEVSIVNVSRDGTDDRGDVEAGEPPERRLKRRKPAAPLTLKLLGDEASQLQEAAAEAQFADTVRLEDEKAEQQVRDGAFERTIVTGDSGIELPPEEAVPELTPRNPDAGRSKALGTSDGQDFLAAVRLLMESAGLDAARLPHGTEQQAIVTAGRLIRATVQGIQDVLRTRTLIKSQFQLDLTGIQASNNNPLKFMPSAQEALEQLFYDESEGYLGPVESVENALRDLRAHQSAMVKAMKFAMRDLLERLDPNTLEEKFRGKARPAGLLSRATKPQYWEQYRNTYQQMAAHSDDILLKLVGARFAEGYAAEIQNQANRKPPQRRPG
jgi:type VI secretion system FHA domain protein